MAAHRLLAAAGVLLISEYESLESAWSGARRNAGIGRRIQPPA